LAYLRFDDNFRAIGDLSYMVFEGKITFESVNL